MDNLKILHKYKNGNVDVTIHADGTKIRFTEDDEFKPMFPENIDIKITNKCTAKCLFCHENSSGDGEHGNLDMPFIRTLRPGTELAIGGGNPLSHPGLEAFLIRLKEQGVIANLTVNQLHLKDPLLQRLADNKLFYGLGISFLGRNHDLMTWLSYPGTVVHVIAGIHDKNDILALEGAAKKILILGYKRVRRGITYEKVFGLNPKGINTHHDVRELLPKFEVVSFDNLALEQLSVRKLVTTDVWGRFYNGDDGSHTMYIDMVRGVFSVSSTTTDKIWGVEHDIDSMFKTVHEDSHASVRTVV